MILLSPIPFFPAVLGGGTANCALPVASADAAQGRRSAQGRTEPGLPHIVTPASPLVRQSSGGRVGQHGQSLVEFALMLPALVLVCFGIVQLILMLRADSTVADLARQESQQVALNGRCEGSCLQTLIDHAGLSTAALHVVVTAANADGTAHALPATYGDDVVVQVTYDYGLDIPFLGHLQRTLGASATQVSTTFPGSS